MARHYNASARSVERDDGITQQCRLWPWRSCHHAKKLFKLSLMHPINIPKPAPCNIQAQKTGDQHAGKWLTWVVRGSEALLGHSVVRFELYTHVVILRRDHRGELCSAKRSKQFSVGCQATANLHVIIFANLGSCKRDKAKNSIYDMQQYWWRKVCKPEVKIDSLK